MRKNTLKTIQSNALQSSFVMEAIFVINVRRPHIALKNVND